MRTLRCFVLMPFSGHRSFVYHLAIKKAIDELNDVLATQQGLSLEVRVERADEIPSLHDDKVSQIRKLIQSSDIIIIDISDLNPNVLWELGYSTALHKHILVISEEWKDLPFNVRVVDICKYKFSYEDLSELKNKIIERFKVLIPLASREEESLIRHSEFDSASRQVMSTLKHIREDSLLKELALNELSRIGSRFEKLGKGLFELRNEKPYEEVISYYCEYVSQLRGAESKFDVISNLNFWKEITNDGTDFRYIHANIGAARSGAKVRRIVLIDSAEFWGETVKSHYVYSSVLEQFYNINLELGDSIQTRLLFSRHFAADRKAYGNFGILTKGSEILLFRPQYDGERMTETTFIYFNQDRKQFGHIGEHVNRIKRYEFRFNEAWGRGIDLDEKHFR